jgi:hypothetical protein
VRLLQRALRGAGSRMEPQRRLGPPRVMGDEIGAAVTGQVAEPGEFRVPVPAAGTDRQPGPERPLGTSVACLSEPGNPAPASCAEPARVHRHRHRARVHRRQHRHRQQSGPPPRPVGPAPAGPDASRRPQSALAPTAPAPRSLVPAPTAGTSGARRHRCAPRAPRSHPPPAHGSAGRRTAGQDPGTAPSALPAPPPPSRAYAGDPRPVPRVGSFALPAARNRPAGPTSRPGRGRPRETPARPPGRPDHRPSRTPGWNPS